MTDTPRTDAILRAAQITPLTIYGDFEAALELSRQLECQLTEARAALSLYVAACGNTAAVVDQKLIRLAYDKAQTALRA